MSRVFGQHEAYDPQTDTWEHDVPMLTPRHGFGAVAIGDADRAIPGGRDQSLRAIYLLTRLIGIVVSCVMVLASFSKVVSFWLSLTVAESPSQKGALSFSPHRCQ